MERKNDTEDEGEDGREARKGRQSDEEIEINEDSEWECDLALNGSNGHTRMHAVTKAEPRPNCIYF